jgi:PAS domain S-box-containing protein
MPARIPAGLRFPIHMTDFSAPSGGPAPDRLRRAIEASDSGLALVDARGHWLDFNPAVPRLLGVHEDALREATPLACVAVHDRTAFEAALAACHARGSRADIICSWDCNDAARALRTRVAPVVSGDGETPAVLVQLDAIDDSVDADRARTLQMFADRVSHDLRAPLRSIESFSTLLARRAAERLDDTDRDHLSRIRAAAGRMGGLLDALGEYARAMQVELRSTPVDLSLLAEWVVAELREAEPDRDAALHVQHGLVVLGDERLLKSMLTQLLRNAWTFSRDRDHVHIELDGEQCGDRLRVRVRDRGCGFDMQYAHKLFEPFQRLHGSEHGGGHGLGLAIAHCIAQRHGGSIRAASQPGIGSEFTLELPGCRTGIEER